MHWPGRGERVRPMRRHSIHRAMLPQISPRTYPSPTTDPVYANMASTPDASQPDSSTVETPPRTSYRDDAPHLNYVQVEFAKGPGAARRFQVKEEAAKSGTSEPIYSTVDAIKTARLESAPQSLVEAREQLSNEIRGLVQAFATSNKASLVNKLLGAKASYGAGASITALVQGLNAKDFTRCAEALFEASNDMRQKTRQESWKFVGEVARALTMEALKGLSPEQKKALARHMRQPAVLEKSLADMEDRKSSMAAATARDAVCRALVEIRV